jgi:signal transduction histidine kinase
MEPRCCCCRELITPEDCPFLREGEEALLFNRRRRFLQRCIECPRFLENLRTNHDGCEGLTELFPCAVEEVLALRARNRTFAAQVESRSREVKFLHEVSLVLQASVDMDEVIAMALTAITAGKGFGLNRAVLLLVDKERKNLKGYFAVGPRSPQDAARIWQEVEEQDLPLREMARLFFEQKMSAERERFSDLLEILSTPLSHTEHPFVRTLNDQLSRHVTNLPEEPGISPEQAAALGISELLLVPLVSKKRRIGLLLADNIVNGRPISDEDLASLETFALPVSFAIERTALYERLQEELTKVTEANKRLKEQQELIVRMEKMALVGKITANIAHSIRNPLTIIGGFARTLIKSTPPEDAKRQFIESIVRESRRLEEVLQEVLNYSESQHPTFDLWDMNSLVAAVYAGLRDDLELGSVECRLDFTAGLPLVRIDYKKISYCLRSLIRNAIEAMPRGGTLGIRTCRREDELLILLTDSGQGISAESMRLVTHPFFTTREDGSGLGLPLCARILEEHGARLDIASEAGAGTTITIILNIPTEETHGPTAGR